MKLPHGNWHCAESQVVVLRSPDIHWDNSHCTAHLKCRAVVHVALIVVVMLQSSFLRSRSDEDVQLDSKRHRRRGLPTEDQS